MQTCSISPDTLARMLEEFLLAEPHSVAMEDGDVLFDFRSARYSVSGEGKCVLHLWSEDRNTVRRVLDAEQRGRSLRLSVLRFGKSQPNTLEICADRSQRTASAQRAVRMRYQRLLERVLLREYPGSRIEQLSSRPDLEHSLSPVYARGLLRTGQSAFAVLGVNQEELQPSIDAALTFGIVWMDYQRERLAGRAVVEGLKLFAPAGRSEILRQRMAHLDRSAAKWQIFELDESSEICEATDPTDCGNIETRLVRAVDKDLVSERFKASIERIREFVPRADTAIDSPTEIIFRLHGLEFARARVAPVPGSFRLAESIVFGVRPAEHTLDETTEELFRNLVDRLMDHRHPAGPHGDPVFRVCPERWMESLVVRDVRAIDERLDGRFVYSQVPAFAASDRAMLDVLTCTVDGRLAILELKADEDMHLPLQGLDYWARVHWHQKNGGFMKNGYFAGREVSNAPPLLYLVAPALRTHPTTDVLLRYLSPRIEWALVQVDEHWRAGMRVVNRKRTNSLSTTDLPR